MVGGVAAPRGDALQRRRGRAGLRADGGHVPIGSDDDDPWRAVRAVADGDLVVRVGQRLEARRRVLGLGSDQEAAPAHPAGLLGQRRQPRGRRHAGRHEQQHQHLAGDVVGAGIDLLPASRDQTEGRRDIADVEGAYGDGLVGG